MSASDTTNKGPECVVILSVFLVIPTIAIALRVYVRAWLIKGFGLDDWAALVGWIFFVCTAVFFLLGMAHGGGQHNRLVEPPGNVSIAIMWFWMAEHAYILTNMSIKLSIGLMLLRFIQDRRVRKTIWALIVFLEVFSAIYFLLFVFDCTPPSFFWTRYRGATNGTCFSVGLSIIATYCHSALICLVDWTFAILPWFILRDLQLNRRTKIMTGLALSLGAIASIAMVIRLPYIPTLADQDDYLYATIPVIIWTFLEAALGITASSATTFKPLFKKFLSHNRPRRSASILLPDSTQSRNSAVKHTYNIRNIDLHSIVKSKDNSMSSEESQEEASSTRNLTRGGESRC